MCCVLEQGILLDKLYLTHLYKWVQCTSFCWGLTCDGLVWLVSCPGGVTEFHPPNTTALWTTAWLRKDLTLVHEHAREKLTKLNVCLHIKYTPIQTYQHISEGGDKYSSVKFGCVTCFVEPLISGFLTKYLKLEISLTRFQTWLLKTTIINIHAVSFKDDTQFQTKC